MEENELSNELFEGLWGKKIVSKLMTLCMYLSKFLRLVEVASLWKDCSGGELKRLRDLRERRRKSVFL